MPKRRDALAWQENRSYLGQRFPPPRRGIRRARLRRLAPRTRTDPIQSALGSSSLSVLDHGSRHPWPRQMVARQVRRLSCRWRGSRRRCGRPRRTARCSGRTAKCINFSGRRRPVTARGPATPIEAPQVTPCRCLSSDGTGQDQSDHSHRGMAGSLLFGVVTRTSRSRPVSHPSSPAAVDRAAVPPPGPSCQ